MIRILIGIVIAALLAVAIFVWPFHVGRTIGPVPCGNGVYVDAGMSCPVPIPPPIPGVTPTPSPPNPGNTPVPQECFGGKNFQLGSSLSDSNVYYRVEFNTNGTWPEYESWLPPGTYTVRVGGGHVWEFPASCTQDQLRADATSSHDRRVAGGASGSVLEPNDPIVTSAFIKG